MPYSFDEKVEMRQTGSIKWEHLHKIFGAEDLTPMWVADMDFKGPEPVIEAVKRRAELGIYGYTKPPEYLFESVSRWMENRHGWFVSTEWLSYSPGVVTALSASVRLFTSVGDPVVIQPPVYPPFFKVVEENRRQLVLNPLRWVDGKYRMDFDDLREKVKVSGAKMLILCSPHNPVGRVWEREELEELAQICLEHDLMVVSDEIHADLVYKPNRHIPFLSLSAELEERTIVCTAPSKTFNMAGLQAPSSSSRTRTFGKVSMPIWRRSIWLSSTLLPWLPLMRHIGMATNGWIKCWTISGAIWSFWSILWKNESPH
ncbi:hypothetical protein CULT_40028 [[Clostridium] ultunense Esp]|nr:hypothetical protein CULT_40028 [[Clostridium] ultunense Esp]